MSRTSSFACLLSLGALPLFFAACGGRAVQQEPNPIGAPDRDGGGEGGAPTPVGTPATGDDSNEPGVCCPIVSDPCAACGGGAGGWAASPSECANSGPCDGYIGFGTDAHGCSVVVGGDDVPGAVCCGCVLPDGGPPDTGTPDTGTPDTGPPDAGPPSPSCALDSGVHEGSGGGTCQAYEVPCSVCQEGAGVECSCDHPSDGGVGTWVCVGTGHTCN